MYLLLGSERDPWCSGVRRAVQARGDEARIVENPLIQPAWFSWRLDSERSVSHLAWDDKQANIDGVLVRGGGWIDPAGWGSDDLAYVQAETQATLLAWLASLSCPVVNRYQPALWYRPQLSIVFWRPWLRACGLLTPPTLVSNVEQETLAFRRRLAAEGIPGAIYRPLTSDRQYLLATEEDWTGLAAVQTRAPVCLTYPHEEPVTVCVVGDQLVWNVDPPADASALEPALLRFAATTGLAFVEFAVARASEALHVAAVEHFPHFERFTQAAQDRIVAALVELLVGSAVQATT
jgi:hypothetical protein